MTKKNSKIIGLLVSNKQIYYYGQDHHGTISVKDKEATDIERDLYFMAAIKVLLYQSRADSVIIAFAPHKHKGNTNAIIRYYRRYALLLACLQCKLTCYIVKPNSWKSYCESPQMIEYLLYLKREFSTRDTNRYYTLMLYSYYKENKPMQKICNTNP